jgi:hypothetical protein
VKGRARVPAIHTVSMAPIVSWVSIRTAGNLAVSGHGDEERAGPPYATICPCHRRTERRPLTSGNAKEMNALILV